MTDKERHEFLAQKVAEIVEHFEAVQIFASITEDGLTKGISKGAGNWYARQGQAHEFINSDLAQEHAAQLADRLRKQDG